MEQIKAYLKISNRLGFGFQMQHPDPSGWNRFKNKTLGVSWLNVFSLRCTSRSLLMMGAAS